MTQRNPAAGREATDDPEAPEETMNAPIVIALVGLAISVSLPAFAQQKRAADPQISQQLDVLGQQYDAAFNNGDAAALAGTFPGVHQARILQIESGQTQCRRTHIRISTEPDLN